MSNSEFDSSERGWISRGFEQLVARVEQDPTAVLFDVLIVGSGYGGAIAADTFAGRESAGVPEDVHARADARVVIPMAAGARSLNVAVAAAVALAEARRQLRATS